MPILLRVGDIERLVVLDEPMLLARAWHWTAPQGVVNIHCHALRTETPTPSSARAGCDMPWIVTVIAHAAAGC